MKQLLSGNIIQENRKLAHGLSIYRCGSTSESLWRWFTMDRKFYVAWFTMGQRDIQHDIPRSTRHSTRHSLGESLRGRDSPFENFYVILIHQSFPWELDCLIILLISFYLLGGFFFFLVYFSFNGRVYFFVSVSNVVIIRYWLFIFLIFSLARLAWMSWS